MMMITPHRHKRRTPPILYLAGSGLVIVILFFSPLPSIIARSVQFIGTPVLRFEGGLYGVFAPVSTYFKSKSSLEARIHELEQENQSLRHDGLMGTYLFYENQQLRMALGRDESPNHGTLASVLAGPARSPYDTLLIDAGKNRSVVQGALVTTPAGNAIGTISSVFDRSAVVTLFSSASSATRVQISTSSPHAIKAEGKGGGGFEIKLPREMTVAIGDAVLLPGTPAHTIGTVEKVVSDTTSAFQSVLFSYPENIFSLRAVIVGQVPVISNAWDEHPIEEKETN